MVKNDDSEYSVGYKKPPRHSQFKPGQSGNPNGRPKKVKGVLEVLTKEVLAVVTLVEQSGKRQRVSMLEAILKHCVRNAAKGNLKATAMVLNYLKPCQDDGGDNLGELLQHLRARHAGLVAADSHGTPNPDASELNQPANVDASGPPPVGS
jgi:hypothetical protein